MGLKFQGVDTTPAAAFYIYKHTRLRMHILTYKLLPYRALAVARNPFISTMAKAYEPAS